MRSTGIRELRNGLSRYLRQLKPGHPIAITDRGRVIAELRAPSDETSAEPLGKTYARLVDSGAIRPALDGGDALEHWPSSRTVNLARGTASALIDEDRGA